MNLGEALQKTGDNVYRFIRVTDNLYLQDPENKLDNHEKFATGLGVLGLIKTLGRTNPENIDAGEITIINTPEERSQPTGVRLVRRAQKAVYVGGFSYSLGIPVPEHKTTARTITVNQVRSLSPDFDIRS